MKSIYIVAGFFIMLVQGSWQHSLQDMEEKPRYSSVDSTEPVNMVRTKFGELRLVRRVLMVQRYGLPAQFSNVEDTVVIKAGFSRIQRRVYVHHENGKL